MALFGKLFEKKECAICGGEIGLLGNRKLEDGNMCKHCAAKLSPWFEDRRSSTVAQINQQLEYREANKAKVAAFNTTRTLGNSTKVLLDEDAGVFMVGSSFDPEEDNPDVLSFSDVTGCELDIDEDKYEMKHADKDGNQVSYNPPRYRYSYNFHITIHVRNPYFDDIRFKLNTFSVDIETPAGMMGRPMGGRPGAPGGNAFGRMMGSFASARIDPNTDVEFCRYRDMGEEIRDALLQVRQQARDEKVAAAAPKASVTCPYCGATTTPDASGCCAYCGGAVNA